MHESGPKKLYILLNQTIWGNKKTKVDILNHGTFPIIRSQSHDIILPLENPFPTWPWSVKSTLSLLAPVGCMHESSPKDLYILLNQTIWGNKNTKVDILNPVTFNFRAKCLFPMLSSFWILLLTTSLVFTCWDEIIYICIIVVILMVKYNTPLD